MARQLEPGALTASLAWYRALRHRDGRGWEKVHAPTLYVWSTGDTALGRYAAEHTVDHVLGPYRFEVLEGVSHWIPEEAPAQAAELIAEHASAHAVG